jgi:hypothetical protein
MWPDWRVGPGLQAEARAERWDALDLYIKRVLLCDGSEFGHVGPNRSHFSKVIFEASRRNDFDDFARAVARVPERMPLLAPLEDPRPRFCNNDVIA